MIGGTLNLLPDENECTQSWLTFLTKKEFCLEKQSLPDHIEAPSHVLA